jgi:outer membrane lipoprotein-sorting protein
MTKENKSRKSGCVEPKKQISETNEREKDHVTTEVRRITGVRLQAAQGAEKEFVWFVKTRLMTKRLEAMVDKGSCCRVKRKKDKRT